MPKRRFQGTLLVKRNNLKLADDVKTDPEQKQPEMGQTNEPTQ